MHPWRFGMETLVFATVTRRTVSPHEEGAQTERINGSKAGPAEWTKRFAVYRARERFEIAQFLAAGVSKMKRGLYLITLAFSVALPGGLEAAEETSWPVPAIYGLTRCGDMGRLPKDTLEAKCHVLSKQSLSGGAIEFSLELTNLGDEEVVFSAMMFLEAMQCTLDSEADPRVSLPSNCRMMVHCNGDWPPRPYIISGWRVRALAAKNATDYEELPRTLLDCNKEEVLREAKLRLQPRSALILDYKVTTLECRPETGDRVEPVPIAEGRYALRLMLPILVCDATKVGGPIIMKLGCSSPNGIDDSVKIDVIRDMVDGRKAGGERVGGSKSGGDRPGEAWAGGGEGWTGRTKDGRATRDSFAILKRYPFDEVDLLWNELDRSVEVCEVRYSPASPTRITAAEGIGGDVRGELLVVDGVFDVSPSALRKRSAVHGGRISRWIPVSTLRGGDEQYRRLAPLLAGSLDVDASQVFFLACGRERELLNLSFYGPFLNAERSDIREMILVMARTRNDALGTRIDPRVDLLISNNRWTALLGLVMLKRSGKITALDFLSCPTLLCVDDVSILDYLFSRGVLLKSVNRSLANAMLMLVREKDRAVARKALAHIAELIEKGNADALLGSHLAILQDLEREAASRKPDSPDLAEEVRKLRSAITLRVSELQAKPPDIVGPEPHKVDVEELRKQTP